MKRYILPATALIFAMSAQGATHKVAPGQLAGIISGGTLDSETTLRLTGAIDARDLAAIGSLPASVKTLDLSEAEIAPLSLATTEYFGRSYFGAGEIPCYAFFKSEVETLSLPKGTSVVGDGAFAGSQVRKVVIPEGVGIIGDYAFYNCPQLEEVVFPQSLSSLGKGALAQCPSLKVVTLLATRLSRIEDRTFAGSSSLREVELPASVAYVGREAFTGTAVSRLDVAGVTSFGEYALSGMPCLESVALNPAAQVTGGMLMDNASLTSLQGAPETIPDYFLANCTSLEPTSVLTTAQSVGAYALANHQTSEIVLGPQLSHLDSGAFHGMAYLEKIDATGLGGDIPAVADDTFSGLQAGNVWVYVTEESFDLWKDHPVWGKLNIRSDSREWLEVESVAAADGIAISLLGTTLRITAPEAITEVALFSIDGRLLHRSSPGATEAEISLEELGESVLLVNARAGEASKSSKILL